jgi:hypothetical protein
VSYSKIKLKNGRRCIDEVIIATIKRGFSDDYLDFSSMFARAQMTSIGTFHHF